MSETKFTPGPWEWDGDPCNASAEYRDQEAPWLCATATRVLRGDIYATKQADVRLIAAAPELYAALDALLQAAPFIVREENQNCSEILQARAALAKARGETP